MMNYGRKLLSLLLALMLLLGMAQGVAFAAGTTVTLVPSATQPLNPGDSFTVTAQISGNTGYNAVGFCIDFDRNALELVSFDTDRKYAMSVLSAVTNTAKTTTAHPTPFGFITGAAANPETSDDDMFLMNFKVKTGAQAGSYTIKIDPTNGEHVFAKVNTDQSVSPLNASFVSTSVTVAASQPAEPTIVPVSGIALNKQSLSLEVNGTATLTATVSPEDASDKSVIWSSSNSSIASVENGLVTGKAAGEATITATAGSYSASARVTVSQPAAPVEGDHADIALNSASLVEAGGVAIFDIFVDNHDEASSYNSFEFNLSYDAARLSYSSIANTISNEKRAAMVSGNSITVNGYGDTKSASGTIPVVSLAFEIKDDAPVGAASVTLTEAYRSTSAHAVSHDIDEIAIGVATATATIEEQTPEYTVSFDKDVKINNETKTSCTVVSGDSLSFNVIEMTGHTASVTVDGAPLTANADGSYTIANITKDTSVSIGYTANRYTVTVTGSGASDVTAATTATHGTAFSFSLNKQDGFNYSVSVKVGGNTVSTVESNGSYTIVAGSVTGDIAITATKEAKQPVAQRHSVTFYKNGTASSNTAEATAGQPYSFTADVGYVIYKVDMNGAANSEFNASAVSISSVTGDIAIYMGQTYTVTLPDDNTVVGNSSANYGSNYSFTVEDGYTAIVTVGGSIVNPSPSQNGFIISGSQITGAIVITAQRLSYASSVMVYDYVKSSDATLIQLVVAQPSGLATGELLQFGGQNMRYSSKYNGYAYLVAVESSASLLTNETAAAQIGKAEASVTNVDYSGDVNMTGKLDINDAQLVYDIYKANYSNFTSVSIDKMLRADVNGSHDIDVADVTAVVAKVRS